MVFPELVRYAIELLGLDPIFVNEFGNILFELVVPGRVLVSQILHPVQLLANLIALLIQFFLHDPLGPE